MKVTRKEHLEEIRKHIESVSNALKQAKYDLDVLEKNYGICSISASTLCGDDTIHLASGIELVAEAMGKEIRENDNRGYFMTDRSRILQIGKPGDLVYVKANENGKAKYDLHGMEE